MCVAGVEFNATKLFGERFNVGKVGYEVNGGLGCCAAGVEFNATKLFGE